MADDQIYEKYQARAIEETNSLGHEIAHWVERAPSRPRAGDRHRATRWPTSCCSSTRPQPAEVQEGVAFFGRAGQAVLRSIERLRDRPAEAVRHALPEARRSTPSRRTSSTPAGWLTREIHIVQPGDDRGHGRAAAVGFLDGLGFPLAAASTDRPGEIQHWTPTIDVLPVPDIDESLNEAARQAGLLGGVPDARRVVREPAAVLIRRRPGGRRAGRRSTCSPRTCRRRRPGEVAGLALISLPLVTITRHQLLPLRPARPAAAGAGGGARPALAAVLIVVGYAGSPATHRQAGRRHPGRLRPRLAAADRGRGGRDRGADRGRRRLQRGRRADQGDRREAPPTCSTTSRSRCIRSAAAALPRSAPATSSSLGLFLASAARLDLRPRATWAATTASFGLTMALSYVFDAALPALPLLSLGFLAANGDLLWRAQTG